MSLETEIAKAKTNKDNMKKAKADTDSVLTELGGEASTSLSDVPNKIRTLGTTLLDQSKEYTNTKVSEVNTNKANKSTKHKIVLSKDSWSGAEAPYNYEISIPGMDEHKNWEVTNSTDPIMTVEELDAFSNARIIAGTQTTDKINLVAYGEKPAININILVIVRGD